MEVKPTSSSAPLDLSRWRNVPTILMFAGGAVSLLGLFNPKEFAFSWLLAFMFFLSLCLGALFLVLAHHLFDAGWSVAIRRFCEHIASLLFPWMFFLFIPIALFAKSRIYLWMNSNPATDKALAVKNPLFTMPGFYLVSAGCFAVWWLLTNRLRFWSPPYPTKARVNLPLG